MTTLNEFDFSRGSQGEASADEVRSLETLYGGPLPTGYLELLQNLNGWFGSVLRKEESDDFAHVHIYAAATVAEVNEGYEVPETESSLLLIGTDGGGNGILITKGGDPIQWVFLPFMDFGTTDPRYRYEQRFDSFGELLNSLMAL